MAKKSKRALKVVKKAKKDNLKEEKKVRKNKSSFTIGYLFQRGRSRGVQTWELISHSPLSMGLMRLIPGALVLGLVLGVMKNDGSRLKINNSTLSPLSYWRVAEIAALRGDYERAREVYKRGSKVGDNSESPVLGIKSEIENMIWPENKIREEIRDLEEKVIETRSSYLYLRLAELYFRLNDNKKTEEYLELARSIDPNNDWVKEFEENWKD